MEGMLFVGALAGYKVGMDTGDPWLGLLAAMVAGAALAAIHAVVCIHFQADESCPDSRSRSWARASRWC
ncbi:MAG: hypothetical protein U0667_02000 [Chloroflexota bacterium]